MIDETLFMHMMREKKNKVMSELNSYFYIDLCNGDYSMLHSACLDTICPWNISF